ncbi:hypothetical protein CGRA01v4_06550 [Colletotrichum graminicola]|nr:hypothetical protein CGRA01v4_06550 [Colletotrichum graminicola]
MCLPPCNPPPFPGGGAKSSGSARDVARSSDRAPACTWQLVAPGVAPVRGGGGAHAPWPAKSLRLMTFLCYLSNITMSSFRFLPTFSYG